MAGGMIRALLQSADGDIWIGAWDGVTRFDGSRFRSLSSEQGITKTLALAEDLQGNIWFGTTAAGAMRLARNGFSAYTETDGLADTAIASVFESRAGDLYVVSRTSAFTASMGPIHRGPAQPVRRRWPIVGPCGAPRSDAGDVVDSRAAPDCTGFPKVDDVRELGRVRPNAIHTTRDGLAGDDVFALFEDSRGYLDWPADADHLGAHQMGAGHRNTFTDTQTRTAFPRSAGRPHLPRTTRGTSGLGSGTAALRATATAASCCSPRRRGASRRYRRALRRPPCGCGSGPLALV